AKRSTSELWTPATSTRRPRVARVPGVARVVVQGGRAPEIAVEVNPARLAAYHLSLTDVEDALSKANIVKAVGRLETGFKQYQALVSGELTSADQLGEVVVSQRSGIPIALKQIAEIHPAEEDRTTVVTANGQEAVLI